MNTPRTTAQALAYLMSAYPRQQWPAATVEVYHIQMHDIPPAAVCAAVLQWCSDPNDWPPSPGRLRSLAFDLVDGQRGVPSAEESLAEVLSEIRRVGYMGAPEFSHPNVQATVDAIGGWRMLCLSTEWISDRARFLDCYANVAARTRRDERMLPQVRDTVAKLAAGLAMPALPKGETP